MQRSFSEFETELSFKLEIFESNFFKYADAIETSKPTDFITNINIKLNLVAGIEAENEQKLKEKKSIKCHCIQHS